MAIGGTRANQGVGWLLLVTEVNIELCCSGATLGAMKTIIAVLLFSSLAMGQNLRDQQACYRQSKKVADKAVTFANHFDGKTCWVEEFNNTSSSPVVYERWVFNAFESYSTESYFQGELGKSPNVCFVGSQPCRSINEFDILVTKKYGLK